MAITVLEQTLINALEQSEKHRKTDLESLMKLYSDLAKLYTQQKAQLNALSEKYEALESQLKTGLKSVTTIANELQNI